MQTFLNGSRKAVLQVGWPPRNKSKMEEAVRNSFYVASLEAQNQAEELRLVGLARVGDLRFASTEQRSTSSQVYSIMPCCSQCLMVHTSLRYGMLSLTLTTRQVASAAGRLG